MCLLTGLCKVIRLEEKTQNFLTLLRWIFCRFHPCRKPTAFCMEPVSSFCPHYYLVMSRRRSLRKTSSSPASNRGRISPSIRNGLQSIVEGNEAYVSKLLSLKEPQDNVSHHTLSTQRITDSLVDCMTMNNLSPEMILSQFFDSSVLSVYSENVLKKSGKGSALQLSARIAKEWQRDGIVSLGSTLTSKRKRSESHDESKGSKKTHCENRTEKETNEEEDDWRRPLFYWKGTFERADNKASPLLWKGSWVSGLSEDGIPSDEKYQATVESNSFNVYGKLDVRKEDEKDCFLDYLAGRKGHFNKGGYFLDQEDGRGPTRFKDISHRFVFAPTVHRNEGDADVLFVTASGKTEFGMFISFGYVHILKGSGKSELVLARRYIGDNDSRQTLVQRLSQITTANSPHDKNFWAESLPRR